MEENHKTPLQEGSVIRLDVNARSGGVKRHEKKVIGGWGATLKGVGMGLHCCNFNNSLQHFPDPFLLCISKAGKVAEG